MDGAVSLWLTIGEARLTSMPIVGDWPVSRCRRRCFPSSWPPWRPPSRSAPPPLAATPTPPLFAALSPGAIQRSLRFGGLTLIRSFIVRLPRASPDRAVAAPRRRRPPPPRPPFPSVAPRAPGTGPTSPSPLSAQRRTSPRPRSRARAARSPPSRGRAACPVPRRPRT